MRRGYWSIVGLVLFAGAAWMGNMQLSKLNGPIGDEMVQRLEDDLSSPEGLMRLVPALKNVDGQFEIPDPNVDLQKYLDVRLALLNIIEMALVKANYQSDPYSFSRSPHTPLTLTSEWSAVEVGFVTDAQTVPDFSNGGFGFKGNSFLNGVVPVKGTNNSFYTVPGSAVYMNLMPTSLACVNRIMETSGLNGGTMMSTSFALGRKDGRAYLIVNGCQNTAKTITIGDQKVLAPGASSFLGMQIAKD